MARANPPSHDDIIGTSFHEAFSFHSLWRSMLAADSSFDGLTSAILMIADCGSNLCTMPHANSSLDPEIGATFVGTSIPNFLSAMSCAHAPLCGHGGASFVLADWRGFLRTMTTADSTTLNLIGASFRGAYTRHSLGRGRLALW
mmetsp:Transcript_22310/g.40987  ORF Transcript_22310/g.40987 Transcript_22310/m.40987 type:complete len:144 (-) Transcript_22310:103-534(-)